MATINKVLSGHAEKIVVDTAFLWRKMRETRIVVTGSTGLIGSAFVRAVLTANDILGCGIKLLLPVRNPAKALGMFGESNSIECIPWHLGDELPELGGIDYFIHAASSTSSQDFSTRPISTIRSISMGGDNTLASAYREGASKYIFLSSMEVYGEVDGMVYETNLGCLDPMKVRSSYPEAKRLVECLCASYWHELGVPTVVLRLAQTFGQGVAYEDTRVFAEFGRCALEGNDIVLVTDGQKKNPYLSVDDAVKALLFALLSGAPGEAYNVANDSTYCSISEMASMVIQEFGASNARVRREFNLERAATFPKPSSLRLSSDKFRKLGWDPVDSLKDMYNSMFASWRAC